MKPELRLVLLLAAFVAGSTAAGSPAAFAQSSHYPRMQSLTPSDIVFRQIQDAVSQGYKAESSGSAWPDFFIASWLSTGNEDLFSLAARLALPYETLAGLNGIAKPGPIASGVVMLVPSMAGLFVPDKPESDMDLLLAARLASESRSVIRVQVRRGGSVGLYSFYPGARLYATERSFFLHVGFRMPLPKGVLTSSYGMRQSPIDGHDRMHAGVDMAAPSGTDVLAARAGTVSATGIDSALGLYVIISHEGNWRTVYGHLSAVNVELNQLVLSGTIIGAVGSTGLSTGPHLHFEIRSGGSTRDPSSYIPGMAP